MTLRSQFRFVVLLAAASFVTAQSAAQPFSRGMVSSGHPAATEAGLNALTRGGNAIDAAVAVGFTLGVVDTFNSGIGGGCFMLIRLANGKFVAIDGRETAPAAATRNMFKPEGKADTRLSQTGALASGVPGELAAFNYALEQFGTKSLAELILPAAEIAAQGFPVDATYAGRLKEVAKDLEAFEGSRAVFFRNGSPLKEGDRLQQSDLAATYRQIARRGPDWFYHGAFAKATEAWMQAHGGLLTATDFAQYRVRLRSPVSTTYRGYKVVSFPPPSSGGVHLIQMLNMLERFKLSRLPEGDRLHVLAETMKFAFADRAHWLGDPDFANVPRGLISKSYAKTLAEGISLEHTVNVPRHGIPPGATKEFFSDKHTTHFSVADAQGNWVACTATINTTFGSKVVIPGTGVVMNNQMDDFSVEPGAPNHFGLVGAEANSVAPGKRPLSSMTPTIVLKQGKPVMALGAAGGPKIITAVLVQLVALMDLGVTPTEASSLPRIHHQWSPDELLVEHNLSRDLQAELSRRGHKVKEMGALSTSHLIVRDPGTGAFSGAADPRSRGAATGW